MPPSDIGIVREFKDHIARTYRFLVRFVKSNVAECAIRKVIDPYTGKPPETQQEPNCAAAYAQVSSVETATPVPTPEKGTRLAPFQFSEFKHIRKRYPTSGQIGRGHERHALELLKSCGISSPVQKQKHK
jgi:hypothetical protein